MASSVLNWIARLSGRVAANIIPQQYWERLARKVIQRCFGSFIVIGNDRDALSIENWVVTVKCLKFNSEAISDLLRDTPMACSHGQIETLRICFGTLFDTDNPCISIDLDGIEVVLTIKSSSSSSSSSAPSASSSPPLSPVSANSGHVAGAVPIPPSVQPTTGLNYHHHDDDDDYYNDDPGDYFTDTDEQLQGYAGITSLLERVISSTQISITNTMLRVEFPVSPSSDSNASTSDQHTFSFNKSTETDFAHSSFCGSQSQNSLLNANVIAINIPRLVFQDETPREPDSQSIPASDNSEFPTRFYKRIEFREIRVFSFRESVSMSQYSLSSEHLIMYIGPTAHGSGSPTEQIEHLASFIATATATTDSTIMASSTAELSATGDLPSELQVIHLNVEGRTHNREPSFAVSCQLGFIYVLVIPKHAQLLQEMISSLNTGLSIPQTNTPAVLTPTTPTPTLPPPPLGNTNTTTHESGTTSASGSAPPPGSDSVHISLHFTGLEGIVLYQNPDKSTEDYIWEGWNITRNDDIGMLARSGVATSTFGSNSIRADSSTYGDFSFYSCDSDSGAVFISNTTDDLGALNRQLPPDHLLLSLSDVSLSFDSSSRSNRGDFQIKTLTLDEKYIDNNRNKISAPIIRFLEPQNTAASTSTTTTTTTSQISVALSFDKPITVDGDTTRATWTFDTKLHPIQIELDVSMFERITKALKLLQQHNPSPPVTAHAEEPQIHPVSQPESDLVHRIASICTESVRIILTADASANSQNAQRLCVELSEVCLSTESGDESGPISRTQSEGITTYHASVEDISVDLLLPLPTTANSSNPIRESRKLIGIGRDPDSDHGTSIRHGAAFTIHVPSSTTKTTTPPPKDPSLNESSHHSSQSSSSPGLRISTEIQFVQVLVVDSYISPIKIALKRIMGPLNDLLSSDSSETQLDLSVDIRKVALEYVVLSHAQSADVESGPQKPIIRGLLLIRDSIRTRVKDLTEIVVELPMLNLLVNESDVIQVQNAPPQAMILSDDTHANRAQMRFHPLQSTNLEILQEQGYFNTVYLKHHCLRVWFGGSSPTAFLDCSGLDASHPAHIGLEMCADSFLTLKSLVDGILREFVTPSTPLPAQTVSPSEGHSSQRKADQDEETDWEFLESCPTPAPIELSNMLPSKLLRRIESNSRLSESPRKEVEKHSPIQRDMRISIRNCCVSLRLLEGLDFADSSSGYIRDNTSNQQHFRFTFSSTRDDRCVELNLCGVNMQLDTFHTVAPNNAQDTAATGALMRLFLSVQNIEIEDKVERGHCFSLIKRLCKRYNDQSAQQPMLTFVMEQEQTGNAPHIGIRVQLVPLELHIHRDTIISVLSFFVPRDGSLVTEDEAETATAATAEDPIENGSREEAQFVPQVEMSTHFDQVHIDPIVVVLRYHPATRPGRHGLAFSGRMRPLGRIVEMLPGMETEIRIRQLLVFNVHGEQEMLEALRNNLLHGAWGSVTLAALDTLYRLCRERAINLYNITTQASSSVLANAVGVVKVWWRG